MTQVGFASHAGRRTSNQDNALLDSGSGIYAVADGVGGGSAGEEAAAIACAELISAHRRGQPLNQGILNGHQELRKLAKTRAADTYSATTIASLGLLQRRADIAWVGDSRVYLKRQGQLLQMTTDHNLEDQQHVLTQALGAPLSHPLRVDHLETPREEGDIWLICSDGLHTVVDDQALLDCLSTDLSAQEMCDQLLQQALRQGADDNVTVVVVKDVDVSATRAQESAASNPEYQGQPVSPGAPATPLAVSLTPKALTIVAVVILLLLVFSLMMAG